MILNFYSSTILDEGHWFFFYHWFQSFRVSSFNFLLIFLIWLKMITPQLIVFATKYSFICFDLNWTCWWKLFICVIFPMNLAFFFIIWMILKCRKCFPISKNNISPIIILNWFSDILCLKFKKLVNLNLGPYKICLLSLFINCLPPKSSSHYTLD